CAAICGADNWVAIELFAKSKEAWFKKFLALPNGIPSHDTLGRLFAALDPNGFRDCFVSWVQGLRGVMQGEVVAIDGKTLRRSFDANTSKAAIHMVNAWASSTGISLGQLATDAKSNEITAVPKLLDILAIKGCVVTIDAMGCQKDIAAKIVAKEADYVLALKGNQGTLHKEVEKFFEWARTGDADAPVLSFDETVDGEHGRVEIRRCWTTNDVGWFADKSSWKKLTSFAMVESERTVSGNTSLERRYYISSLCGDDASSMARAIRAHWGVENSLHWVLDVAFREDDSRIRTGHAAENFGVIRQIALNLLKQDKSVKVGIANKRLHAGWDHDYLLKILGI
ncbi:MAG: ISAs1 family transposase, partial [Symploca sp. SIO1C2]|nr:ISAs1 family transposase [Symploca sp. SIO1C2]